MTKKLTVGYFYKNLLNLYGDNGNVEILSYRAKKRGFDTEVVDIEIDSYIDANTLKQVNVVFMGGGPDSGQKTMYEDLVNNKGPFLKEYIESGGVGLFICGSYQLLGHYYKPAEGPTLKGLGIFDMYTQHFGNKKPRCIGNTVAKLSKDILGDPFFKSNNHLDDTVVGFENHGGRTYLGKEMTPFANIMIGHGNNSEDKTEGALYKNSIGTYFHGPILARNPHLADYLIAKGLGIDKLDELDDSLIIAVHTASEKFKQ